MIILFHLKLDKFYCITVAFSLNLLGYELIESDLLWFVFCFVKKIYIFIFVNIKIAIIGSINKKYFKKQKKNMTIMVIKKKMLSIIKQVKMF